MTRPKDDERTALEARAGELEQEIMSRRAELAELQRRLATEPIEDLTFRDADGEVRLSDLFGDRDDLLLVHNMGRRCPWCTLWGDGFNGALGAITSRASFVVSSPDEPEVQGAFHAERGWQFRMVSAPDAVIERFGFKSGDQLMPGVSALRRETDGSIRRVGRAWFGPRDDFCAVWHLFDLLAGGPGDWRPAFQ